MCCGEWALIPPGGTLNLGRFQHAFDLVMPTRERIHRLINWKTALAELLILVAGILLALAVDRWVEEQRDAKTANEYVARLRSDVATDLAAYADTVAWSHSIDDSSVYVLHIYRGRNPPPDEYDLLALHLFRASWASKGRTTTTTYDDLVSTGNMALLPVRVRDAITNYYGLKNAYERRLAVMEETARSGYWRTPEAVLGPDLTPRVWLGIQGHRPDFRVEQGELGLSEADVVQIVSRLRAIQGFEAQLSEIRHQMMQRLILFGERLPGAARELEAALQTPPE